MYEDALVTALAMVTIHKFEENFLAPLVLPVLLGGLEMKMTKNIILEAFFTFLYAV